MNDRRGQSRDLGNDSRSIATLPYFPALSRWPIPKCRACRDTREAASLCAGYASQPHRSPYSAFQPGPTELPPNANRRSGAAGQRPSAGLSWAGARLPRLILVHGNACGLPGAHSDPGEMRQVAGGLSYNARAAPTAVRFSRSAGKAKAIADSRWRSGYSAPLTARAGNRPRDFPINREAPCQPRAPRSGARADPTFPVAAVAGDFEHRQLAFDLAKGD
jgi:hypothetical protein